MKLVTSKSQSKESASRGCGIGNQWKPLIDSSRLMSVKFTKNGIIAIARQVSSKGFIANVLDVVAVKLPSLYAWGVIEPEAVLLTVIISVWQGFEWIPRRS